MHDLKLATFFCVPSVFSSVRVYELLQKMLYLALALSVNVLPRLGHDPAAVFVAVAGTRTLFVLDTTFNKILVLVLVLVSCRMIGEAVATALTWR